MMNDGYHSSRKLIEARYERGLSGMRMVTATLASVAALVWLAACGDGVSSLGGKNGAGGGAGAGETSSAGKVEPSGGAGAAGATATGGAGVFTSGGAGIVSSGGAGSGGASGSVGQGGSVAHVDPRCQSSTYTQAPSGAACEPLRFLQANGLAGNCYAPPIGATCQDLLIDLSTTEPAPAGFHCGPDRSTPKDPNIQSCRWVFADDMQFGRIDAAALEAVCAATVAYPKHSVLCLNYID